MFGIFAAVVLLLAGAVVLHSAWVTAAVAGGAAVGFVIGWIGHSGSRGTEVTPLATEEPGELTLLEPQ